MTRQLADEIIPVFAAYGDLDASQLSGATELKDLGIHSLELTEIIMELEEKYDVSIEIDTVDAWASLSTINDVVRAVDELLAAKVN